MRGDNMSIIEKIQQLDEEMKALRDLPHDQTEKTFQDKLWKIAEEHNTTGDIS